MTNIPPVVTDTRNKILAFVQDNPKTTAIIGGVLVLVVIAVLLKSL